MTHVPHPLARSARAVLVGAIGLGLASCAQWGSRESDTNLEQYRRYMAERAAAEAQKPEPEQAPSFEETLASARRSHRAGDPERAMRLYLEAFRLDPTDSRSHAGIAYLQLAREPEQAEDVFRKVIAADPSSTMAYVGLGLARLAQGEPEQASAFVERALALDPSSADAHGAYALVLGSMQLYEDAQRHARRAAELAPQNSAIVNNYGIASLRAGDAVLAEKAFRDAIALESRDSAYRNNLGIALGRQRRYAEALRAFRSAGGEQAAQNNLGYVYYMNGLLDDAVIHYELALQAEGDDDLKILRNLDVALDAKRAAGGESEPSAEYAPDASAEASPSGSGIDVEGVADDVWEDDAEVSTEDVADDAQGSANESGAEESGADDAGGAAAGAAEGVPARAARPDPEAAAGEGGNGAAEAAAVAAEGDAAQH